jgi:tetratricopeptide (TPR) repeat protein
MTAVPPSTAPIVGRYDLLGALGQGGFATVYRAHDRRVGREVAIKMLRADVVPIGGIERFLREIQLAARLEHPRIVHVHDAGTHEGMPFYVMDYVAGRTLEARLAVEGMLPIDDALTITVQVGEALAHAHAAGIVHRDVKPANILLGAGGARLADFGIAKALGDATGGSMVTSAGIAVGTLPYMSPEQLCADPLLAARTDQYSLALVCYELLTGIRPHEATGFEGVRAMRLAGQTVPPSARRPALPLHIDAALLRALAPTPADRHRDVGEFLTALVGRSSGEQLIVGGSGDAWRRLTPAAQPATVPSTPPSSPVASTERPRRWRVAGMAALGVAAVVGSWQIATRGTRAGGGRPAAAPAALGSADAPVIAFVPGDDAGAASLTAAVRTELENWPAVRLRARGDTTPTTAWRLSLSPVGDSVRLGITVLDATGGEVDRVLRMAAREWASPAVLRPLARRALLGPASDSVPGWTSLREPSLPAARQYLAGWAALQRGAFDTAAVAFADAGRQAPSFAHAHLWDAQARQWDTPKDASQWRDPVRRALGVAGGLTGADSAIAAGLAAMAAGDPPAACGHYRSAVANAPDSFQAWYGLGDCQRYDSIVVRGPEGWRFRSSHWGALRAYRVAAAHLSASTASRLLDALVPATYASGSRGRRGIAPSGATGRTQFMAFPDGDGDSIAFRPSDIAGGPPPFPPQYDEALRRGRGILLELATAWTRMVPTANGPWARAAVAQELLGQFTDALRSLDSAEARPSSPIDRADRTIVRVRLLMRLGQHREAAAVATAAVSAAESRRSPAVAVRIAPLAFLLGRQATTDELLRAAATATDAPERLPGWLAPALPVSPSLRDSLRLVGTALVRGECLNMRVDMAGLDARIRAQVASRERSAYREALLRDMLRSAVLCPDASIADPLPPAGPLDEILSRIAAGDRTGARSELARLQQRRGGTRLPSITWDGVLLETAALLRLGDTTAAVERVTVSLQHVEEMNVFATERIEQTGAFRTLLTWMVARREPLPAPLGRMADAWLAAPMTTTARPR